MKRIMPLIELGPQDAKNAQDLDKFFEANDIKDLIQRMLPYIKTQTKNPKFTESSVALDRIMHLYINFHRLALTRGGSNIDLPEWLKS